MGARSARRAFALLAHIMAIAAMCPRDVACADIGESPSRRHFIGISTAFYHNRFIDDVMSPAVYTSSSPLYELYYHYHKSPIRTSISLKVAPYTARLRDFDGGDDMTLIGSSGRPYSFPRSLHRLDGTHLELEAAVSWHAYASERRRIAFDVGFSVGMYRDDVSATVYADYDYKYTSETWLDDAALALQAGLERRFRRFDRLALDARFTVLTGASRPPYSFEVKSDEETDGKDGANNDPAEEIDYSVMFPNTFLRWSAQLTYELKLGSRMGLEAYYRFQHQKVTEPRDLRYVSHMLGVGIEYGIK